MEPDFQVPVWKYTYTEGSGADTIFLHSPQEFEDQEKDTILLRQINSDAENKVWIQGQASVHFKRCDKSSDDQLMDDAHGVIVRDGQAKLVVCQGESTSLHRYKRGDRVWVERSLVPTHDIGKDENNIPVVDLESFVLFWIPFEYICFVPQFTKKDLAGEQHAASPGAVLNTFQGKRKTKARIYFHWPVSNPQSVSYMWLDKKNKEDARTMKSFNNITPLESRRKAFRKQWEALTEKLARSGLLLGDEIVEGDADRFDSSSDSTDEDLALHWSPGRVTLENCCNLSPCPSQNDPELDLVPSYVGGIRLVEHYHVRDDDLDECPQGSSHKSHCVLRDNRTRCAYAIDRVRHTCCKLRTNPLLPGPYGDPDDFTLPLWETTVGNEYFVDASKNVQTRKELEDRDDVPPQMQRLRQQLLSEAEPIPTQDAHDGIQQDEPPMGVVYISMPTGPLAQNPIRHSSQQPIQQHGERQQRLTNAFAVDMVTETPRRNICVMNQDETIPGYTQPQDQYRHISQLPENLKPLLGTVIPITISPSARTLDRTYNPITSLSIPGALSMPNVGLSEHMVPISDMPEWNPITQDQHLTQADRFGLVPPTDTLLGVDPTDSCSGFISSPLQGPHMFNQPGD